MYMLFGWRETLIKYFQTVFAIICYVLKLHGLHKLHSMIKNCISQYTHDCMCLGCTASVGIGPMLFKPIQYLEMKALKDIYHYDFFFKHSKFRFSVEF